MLTDYIKRYITVAEILACVALVAGILWGVHLLFEHERQIGRDEVQARWDKQIAADKEAKAKDEARWAIQQTGADTHATDRQQINQAAAAGAAAVAGSLRDAISAIAAPRSDDSATAARKDAATLGALLGECEVRYRDMAAKADGHASDVRTLIEAWPTNAQKAP